MAKLSREKDLPDKFIECNPLPDPSDEKDLTTFITLWRDSKDKTLNEAVNNCQVAQNVVDAIKLLLAEALAQGKGDQISWCNGYIDEIHGLILKKYDEISCHMLTYMEDHINYSEAELAELERKNRTSQNKRGDSKIRDFLRIVERTEDLAFCIWANVAGKQMIKKVNFEFYQSNLPHSQKSQYIVMRNNWASFDFVSGRVNSRKFDTICVGGVAFNRMYKYPELCRNVLKWKMRSVLSENEMLKEIVYPDPQSTAVTEAVQVIYQLPSYVFLTDSDEHAIGVWDAAA